MEEDEKHNEFDELDHAKGFSIASGGSQNNLVYPESQGRGLAWIPIIHHILCMNPEPKLAPPGAGLPFLIAIFARYITGPIIAANSDWNKNAERFEQINQKIFRELEGIDPGLLEQRVLVPPQSGLEDSSRYWSISMTLEHLCIVNAAMKRVILALGNGITPEGEASTAAVKPSGQIPPSKVVQEFSAQVSTLNDDLFKGVKNQKSGVLFKHPWFGPMTAKQWQWLLPAHAGIHLKQIRAIKRGLRG